MTDDHEESDATDLSPDRLHELYVEEDLTVREVGERLNVATGRVVEALHETDWYEPRPSTVLQRLSPEDTEDDLLVTDGGQRIADRDHGIGGPDEVLRTPDDQSEDGDPRWRLRFRVGDLIHHTEWTSDYAEVENLAVQYRHEDSFHEVAIERTAVIDGPTADRSPAPNAVATDGAGDRPHRPDGLEAIVEELRHQNAVLTELVRATHEVAVTSDSRFLGHDPEVPTHTGMLTAIESARVTREEEGGDWP